MKVGHNISVWVVVTCTILTLASLFGAGGCTHESALGGGVSAALRRLPANTEAFRIVNVNALRSDKDLEGAYQSWEENEEWLLRECNIDFHAARVVTYAGHPENDVVLRIYEGSFDLEDVANSLGGRGFQHGESEGVDMWCGDPSGSGNEIWVALMPDLVIVGGESELKECMRTLSGDVGSLESNDNLTDVMRRLPVGICVVGGTYEMHQGLEAWGLSIGNPSKDAMRLSYVYKFSGEMRALDAVTEVTDALSKTDFKPTEAKAKSQYVKGSACMRSRDFETVFGSFYPAVNGVEAANRELFAVQWAISRCMAQVDATQLLAAATGWDGRAGTVQACLSGGHRIADAAESLSLEVDVLRATYDIEESGFVSGGHNIAWRYVKWDSTSCKWVEAP